MRPDVLLVVPHRSTFIDRDEALLRRRFSVATLEYRRRADLLRLLPRIPRCRLMIAWFSLGYAYPMVRFGGLAGVPTVLIAGGWDVEAMPDFGYGAMLLPRRRRRNAFALARAQRVLAVSNFTKGRVERWAPGARVEVLYHGFPASSLPIPDGKAGVLTAATRVSPDTWRLKGLHTFLEAARRLPDVPFTIVGSAASAESLLRGLPPNVRIAGHLPMDRLESEYASAKVYAQLSAVESFGCSLAEAMLLGCVPVVTDRGALPEVVGPVGESVPYGDPDETVRAIRKAIDSNQETAAAERIRSCFPLERRAKGLVAAVETLLEDRT